MKKNLCIPAVLAFGILAFQACTPSNDKKSTISKLLPVPEVLQQKAETMVVKDLQKSQTITLTDGTKLTIPADGFVYENGEPVKGSISLEYKDYQDAAEIVLSGIPMEYDSAGVTQVLQTAGMFELHGHDSLGQAIFIRPEKQVQVSMVTNNKDNQYNFYKYDTISSNWKYLNNNATLEGMNTLEVQKDLPKKPIAPKKFNPDNYVFDIKIDTKDFPEFESMKGLMWQYAGTNAAEDPTKNEWVSGTRWTDAKLTPLNTNESTYTLTLTNEKGSFKTTVTPVLTGKSYAKAMANFKAYEADYQKRIAKLEKENAARQVIYRTVGVARFGLYNHDRIFNNSNPRIAASFRLENGLTLENAVVYHMYGGAATVIRYPANKWSEFAFAKDGGNCLLVFLENGNIATFDNQAFQKLDEAKIKKEKMYSFTLKEQSKESIDVAALRSLLFL